MAQVAVKNHGETRGWGHPCLHYVTCQPAGVARGHDVWYSKWETSAPGLGGPSQRNDSGSPHVHGGQLR